MQLTLKNVGRISSAEIDIRPLTVFIGPNSTNKTWAAYCLYGLLRYMSLPLGVIRHPLTGGADPSLKLEGNLSKNINTAAKRTVGYLLKRPDGEQVAVSSKRTVEMSRADLLRGVSEPIRISLGIDDLIPLLAVPEEIVANTEASLRLDLTEIVHGTVMDNVAFTLDPGSLGLEVNAFSKGNRFINSSTMLPHSQEEESLSRIVKMWAMLQALSVMRTVLAFPAERKALVLVYRLLQGDYQRLLATPISDFAQFLSFSESLVASPGGNSPVSFRRMSSVLEERILNGGLHFIRSDSGGPTPLLRYATKAGPLLTMQASASLVRAFGGIDLYLKTLASAGDTIIIDEPEMNAHPEAQLAIIEFLAMLANGGINILITTHSPYIVDHLKNLIQAGRLSHRKQEQIASRFALGTSQAFLADDKLSAYLFSETGGVEPVLNRKEGTLDWSTFGQVSDRVANLYPEILEASGRG